MICQYCGTQFDPEQGVCPRCGKGMTQAQSKPRASMPKWVWWGIAVAVLAAVIAAVAGIYFANYRSSTWMNGQWGGPLLEVTFRAKDLTFDLAIGEDTRLSGEFAYNDEAFQFTAEDGSIYVYQYERQGANRMRFSFTQGGEEQSITLRKGREMTIPQPEADQPDTPVVDPTPDVSTPLLPTPEDEPIIQIPPKDEPSDPPVDQPVDTPQQPSVQPTPQPTPKPTPQPNPQPNTGSDFWETDVDFESNLKLPRFYLRTEGGVEITDRENYVNMTAGIAGAGKYDLAITAGRVRGRGNSTWLHFDKRPYRVKFDQKVDLFGMGANKDWVLLSNAFDETMMRYYLAFSLAHELGLEYTGDYQYVNLFLNGEYRGVYLLTEQIEEGNSRVDVNSSKTGEVDTGYLIEAIGNFTKVEEERYFTAEWVDGERLDPGKDEFRFYIKSPDETECTDRQYEFIKDYVTQANEAIFKRDWAKIQSLIDVQSMAKMFLVDQVMLNNDMGYCFYLYKKKGDKLYFGPMWDYDQSCGGSSWGGATYKGYKTGTTHEWHLALLEIPEFRELVAKIYQEHQPFIRSMPSLVDRTYQANQYDFDRNNDIWGFLIGDNSKWRRMKELMNLETYPEHLDYLENWLNNRINWLEEDLNIK